MPSSLIQKLNDHAGKTPDEITQALNRRGWFPLSEITEEFFEQHKETTVFHYCCYDSNGEYSYSSVDQRPSWRMVHCQSTYSAFVETLTRRGSSYYFILPSEYIEGELPCTT